MKLKQLAFGSFAYAYSTGHDPVYQNMISDRNFLKRMKTQPTKGDCQKIRDFLFKYRITWIPEDFGHQLFSKWNYLKGYVKQIAGERLATCNLESTGVSNTIRHLYALLYTSIWGGDTTVTKVMHFINPDLFVMRDDDITSHYHKPGDKIPTWDIEDSGNPSGLKIILINHDYGYVRFLTCMQKCIEEINKDFEKLSLPGTTSRYLSEKLGYKPERPLTKFLDDYNWITITKKWPSTIPSWLLNL